MREERRKGFTIVELAVVIGIIAIIAAVIVPTYAQVIKKAKESADRQTMANINRMLAVGELEAEEIKEYKLQVDGHELAYSIERNEVVIVDESENIVAAKDENEEGKSNEGNYKRASEIGSKSGGEQGEPEEPQEPQETDHWESAERVNTELNDTNKKEYNEKTEIYIEDNVTNIPSQYFYGNNKLKRIYIGNGVSEISAEAFANCESLGEVYIAGEGIKIGADAFNGCINLEKINLDKVKTIGQRAFSQCEKLKYIEISEVESLGKFAFKNCKSIKSVTIEKAITLHEDTFSWCEFEVMKINGAIKIDKAEGESAEFTVEELEIGKNGRIKVGEDIWLMIAEIMAKSEGKMKSIRIGEIEPMDGQGIKQIRGKNKEVEIIFDDKQSYEELLNGQSESDVFGDRIIKKTCEEESGF